MNYELYLAFVSITTVLLLSPGPSVLLAINNGVKYGSKLASIGVSGNVVAFQILMIISATGLGAILAASSEFFIVLKIIGAIYLIYLGFKLWFSSVSMNISSQLSEEKQKTPFNLFKEAFFVTISNPKALVFVSALLPQFINTNEALLPQIVLLCLTTAVIHFSIYQTYAVFSSRAKHLLESPTRRSIFNKLSGIIFVSFGAALGLSENKV
jgi:threonine/homoserine/homoserine lactone efflux protein